MKDYTFPRDFLWGAATSSYQIEGGIENNDWAEAARQGKVPKAGQACDSYRRYEEDFDIAKSLSHNAHRFSIEWSRIEPEEGKFDEQAIEHYRKVLQSLRNRGLEPFVTLWHFTLPIWFAEKGGFENKNSPEYFTRYIKYVVGNLKDDARFWITFNEAFTIYAAFTKLSATWPSRGRGVLSFWKTRKNMSKAHICAYKEIKNISADSAMVGIVENNVYVPDTKNFFTTKIRRLFKKLRNFYFLSKNTPYYDFIGLNYYHISRKPVFKEKDEVVPKQWIMEKMNWEVYPEGIYHVLKDLSKLKKPIYITENGIADSTDQDRSGFIKNHLRWVHKAIQDGVKVGGYFYWSLLDNYEWQHGYGPRFGLVEVNYDTMERKIRPSAYEYKRICETNSLSF